MMVAYLRSNSSKAPIPIYFTTVSGRKLLRKVAGILDMAVFGVSCSEVDLELRGLDLSEESDGDEVER